MNDPSHFFYGELLFERYETEIRVTAYFKWLDAGQPVGRDLEFWCSSEQEIFGFTRAEYEMLG